MERIERLTGMPDLDTTRWRLFAGAQESLRRFLALRGYLSVETPLLEPTELFLRKSGGDLAASLYAFEEPGGRHVSLRPEFTSSVVRHFLENRKSAVLPWRAQYAGPVLRFDPRAGASRQFTQVGAEVLGAPSPRADAEVVDIAWRGLAELGVRDHRIVVGDVGLVSRVLGALGLSERAQRFLLGQVMALREGPAGLERTRRAAVETRLLESDARHAELRQVISRLPDHDALGLISELFPDAQEGPWGSRTPDEILERQLRRLRASDDPARVERGLAAVARLALVRGAPNAALAAAGEVLASLGLGGSLLDPLRAFLTLVDGKDPLALPLTVDLGLARGIAYYTGIVFEVLGGDGVSLGGGGRYDGLVRSLGGNQDVPALGFAYNLERVLAAVSARPDGPEVDTLVAPADDRAYRAAVATADRLRAGGATVEVEVLHRSKAERRAYLSLRGIGRVIEVAEDGTEREVDGAAG